MSSFEEYMLNREPKIPTDKDIEAVTLEDESVIGEIAGMWRDHERAIRMLLTASNEPRKKEIIYTCFPAEVTAIREAMAAVESLSDLFIKYEAEYTRLEKAKEPPKEIDPLQSQNFSSMDNGAG